MRRVASTRVDAGREAYEEGRRAADVVGIEELGEAATGEDGAVGDGLRPGRRRHHDPAHDPVGDPTLGALAGHPFADPLPERVERVAAERDLVWAVRRPTLEDRGLDRAA